jgi:hypothetical protein
MTEPIPRDVLNRVRKLAQLPGEARHSKFAIPVTRLTVLKSLCQQPDVANRFVTYLARKVLERVKQGKSRATRPKGATDLAHRQMMSEALAGMEAWQQRPTDDLRQALSDLQWRMQAEQNEYKNIPGGAVRLVTDWDLFLFEQALRCLLHSHEVGYWAYHMARDYAERYDPSHGTGLIPASAPLLQDIVDFWMQEVGVTDQELATPVRKSQAKAESPPARRAHKSATERRKKVRFTHRQGQFLAFIHLYRRLHRRGPAELHMVEYFRVTPPSVHGMVVKLEQLGLITREPGVPRSVRVAILEEEIPPLEDVAGPPW